MAAPSTLRFKFRSDHLAAIAVTLAPLVYFMPALSRGLIVSPDDGILQNVPFRVVAAQIVRSGHLPIWNPYIFSGMPLLGAAQGGILFPLNWFYLVFAASTSSSLMVLCSFLFSWRGRGGDEPGLASRRFPRQSNQSHQHRANGGAAAVGALGHRTIRSDRQAQ